MVKIETKRNLGIQLYLPNSQKSLIFIASKWTTYASTLRQNFWEWGLFEILDKFVNFDRIQLWQHKITPFPVKFWV